MNRVNPVGMDVNICSICREPIESTDSKTLDCCLQIIHNACHQQMLDTGNLTCCFCKAPISQISAQTRAQAAMLRAFQKRKREESEDISMLVKSMYNPDDLDLTIDDQMDNFLVMLDIMAEPIAYKRRLWAEFAEQMHNPASQIQRGWTRRELEDEFAMSLLIRHDQVANLLPEEPFVLSRDLLQATAQALLSEPGLSNEEKKEEWNKFVAGYLLDSENRDVIHLFVVEKKDEFPFLEQETQLTDSSSSSFPSKKRKSEGSH